MPLQGTDPVNTAPSAVVAEPAPSSHWVYDIVPQCQFDGAQILDERDLAGLILERTNRPRDSSLRAASIEVAQSENADEDGLMSWLKSKAPAVAEANDSFVARWGITMPDCDDTYVPSCYGGAFLDSMAKRFATNEHQNQAQS